MTRSYRVTIEGVPGETVTSPLSASPWEAAWERARQAAPFTHRPKRGREDGIAFKAPGVDAIEAAAFLRGRSVGSYLAALDVQHRGDATDEAIVDGLRARMVSDDDGAKQVAPVAAEPSASTGAVVGDDAGSGQVGTVVRVSTNPLTGTLERLEAERADVTCVRKGDGWRLTVRGAEGDERVEVLLGGRGGA